MRQAFPCSYCCKELRRVPVVHRDPRLLVGFSTFTQITNKLLLHFEFGRIPSAGDNMMPIQYGLYSAAHASRLLSCSLMPLQQAGNILSSDITDSLIAKNIVGVGNVATIVVVTLNCTWL